MRITLLLISLLIAAPVTAVEFGEQDCQMLGMAGASAMSNFKNGVSKQDTKASLPPLTDYKDKSTNEYHLLLAMHDTLDEVYAFDPIDPMAYMVYKSETCIAKAKDVEPVSYADAHPKLNACSNGTFGDHLIECSMKAAGAKQY
jgi:hypothetical protein